jgi:hypothetical protein
MMRALVLVAAVFVFSAAGRIVGAEAAEVWLFNQTSAIGGYATQVLGHPVVIETPLGKAVQFNGVDDALFVAQHPLTGAETWTWEVIFRPDEDGAAAQRFFHLSVLDPATGRISTTGSCLKFELSKDSGAWTVLLRLVGNRRRC